MKKLINFFSVLMLVACMVSCGGVGSSKSQAEIEVYKVLLKQSAQEISDACPQWLNNYLTMEGASYDSDDNVFKYYYLADGAHLQANEQGRENVKATLKMSTANSDIKRFLEALVETNTTLVYHYRTEEGRVAEIKFSPSELKSILD